MQEIIFGAASFLLAATAFLIGTRLLHKKKPLYFKLLIGAAGCFALQQLSAVVTLLCVGETESFSIGLLGIFGCNFFLLSANYGQLDRIVDDGSAENKAPRRFALLAPVFIAVCMAGVVFPGRAEPFVTAVYLLVMLPALPASYFNLKHLLMPVDNFGFLRATRGCNAAALGFYVIAAAYLICRAFGGTALCGVASLVMSLAVCGLVISAVKGAKQWGI